MVVKKVSGLLAFLLSISVLAGCAKSQPTTTATTGETKASTEATQKEKTVTIGISQIVEHPALDASRNGFLAALKDKGFEEGKNLKVDFQNAQGEPANALTIAQKFKGDKVDMILAIATPTAQAAYSTTTEIPILITAVTDPVASGLAKSMEKSETNVTGTSDNIPIEKQFDLLKQLVPTAKKVGVLYNTSEKNSELQVENAKKAAPAMGLEVEATGVTSTNDIPQALAALLEKVDVLYIPTDNMIASSMPLVVDQATKKGKAVIGSEKGMVENGALATIGIDYYKLGYETGLKAVEVINGKKPTDIAITYLSDMSLVVNTATAQKLNITIPKEIDEKAEKITGGGK